MTQWKTINEFTAYEVSDDGQVRHRETKRIMSQWLQTTTSGYQRYVATFYDKSTKKHPKRKVHRLVAMAFVKNPKNKPDVDHIDNNSLNNIASNLRWVNKTQNMANMKKPSHNTSGYKGVSWKKDRKKWKAYCSLFGKQYHFGYFDDKEKAKEAVEKGRNELHKKYARHA